MQNLVQIQMQSENYNMLDEPRSMLDDNTDLEKVLADNDRSVFITNNNSLKKHALIMLISRSNQKADTV